MKSSNRISNNLRRMLKVLANGPLLALHPWRRSLRGKFSLRRANSFFNI